MGVTLPLDKMTIAEKLEAMESLWNDLSQNPENIPSPEWHERVLRAREKMEALAGIKKGLTDLEAGRTTPIDEVFEELFSKYDCK